jgi:hypothetical protein
MLLLDDGSKEEKVRIKNIIFGSEGPRLIAIHVPWVHEYYLFCTVVLYFLYFIFYYCIFLIKTNNKTEISELRILNSQILGKPLRNSDCGEIGD